MVQGKKLYFKVSVEVAYCLSFLPWCDFVLVEAGVTKSAAGISTRPIMILNIIVTCDLALLVSSVSQLRSSSMSVTLLVFQGKQVIFKPDVYLHYSWRSRSSIWDFY